MYSFSGRLFGLVKKVKWWLVYLFMWIGLYIMLCVDRCWMNGFSVVIWNVRWCRFWVFGWLGWGGGEGNENSFSWLLLGRVRFSF